MDFCWSCLAVCPSHWLLFNPPFIMPRFKWILINFSPACDAHENHNGKSENPLKYSSRLSSRLPCQRHSSFNIYRIYHSYVNIFICINYTRISVHISIYRIYFVCVECTAINNRVCALTINQFSGIQRPPLATPTARHEIAHLLVLISLLSTGFSSGNFHLKSGQGWFPFFPFLLKLVAYFWALCTP